MIKIQVLSPGQPLQILSFSVAKAVQLLRWDSLVVSRTTNNSRAALDKPVFDINKRVWLQMNDPESLRSESVAFVQACSGRIEGEAGHFKAHVRSPELMHMSLAEAENIGKRARRIGFLIRRLDYDLLT